MGKKINGKELIFYGTAPLTGEQIFCCCTDNGLNITTDTIETTGPNSAWKNFIGGPLSYTLSGEGIASYSSDGNMLSLMQWQTGRLKVAWKMAAGGLMYSGTMLITNITITSQVKDLVKFTYAATGCLDLGMATSATTVSVYLANPIGVRLAGCPNPYPVGVLWYDNTFIGKANNADDVISLFNAYAENTGAYILSGYSGGCDFTMQVAWDSDTTPTFIPAVPGSGFVIGTATPGEVIGIDNAGNVIGP